MQKADSAPLRPISPQMSRSEETPLKLDAIPLHAESFYEVSLYLFWRTSVFLVGYVSAVVSASRRVDAEPHVLLDARGRLGHTRIGSFRRQSIRAMG